MNPDITIEQVRKLEAPTDGFLCTLQANIYGIQFVYFKIRNITKNVGDQTLFQIKKQQKDIGKPLTQLSRTIKYQFGPLFFQLNTIGTTLDFKVGQLPVSNFIMIQKHYFKNKLIKEYEFTVPFCIPNTVNSVETIYQLPELTEQQKTQMINCPWQTKSDSFYFVKGKLIMHNKAQYSYAPFD